MCNHSFGHSPAHNSQYLIFCYLVKLVAASGCYPQENPTCGSSIVQVKRLG